MKGLKCTNMTIFQLLQNETLIALSKMILLFGVKNYSMTSITHLIKVYNNLRYSTISAVWECVESGCCVLHIYEYINIPINISFNTHSVGVFAKVANIMPKFWWTEPGDEPKEESNSPGMY